MMMMNVMNVMMTNIGEDDGHWRVFWERVTNVHSRWVPTESREITILITNYNFNYKLQF